MPMYEFQCPDCSLLFEKLIRTKDEDTMPCPSCKGEATKKLSGFGFKFGSGQTPGNTGVDSLDRSIDKTVGRDAEVRWEAIKDRNARKRAIQHQVGGDTPVPLTKNPHTGEYQPVPESELPRIQELHVEYQEAYTEHTKSREERGQSKYLDSDPYEKFKKKQSSKK